MKSIILFVSLVIGLAFSISVSAHDGRNDAFENRIYRNARLLNQKMLRNCENCTFAESPNADLTCQNQYDSVFGKAVVNIHIAFGYLDDSENFEGHKYAGRKTVPNESVDGGARDGMIYQLTRPCGGDTGACGFVRLPTSQTLLTKMIRYRGRDTLVQLHMTQASATPYFHINTGEGKGRQGLATRLSNENFFGTIGTSDFTVYNGHARSGGGPDFAPPVLRADLHPEYAKYYRVKQPGLRALVSALKSAPKTPPLMAIIGCDTDDLFRKPILKAAPKMGLVTTSDLIYFEESFTATFLVVDGFLRQECADTYAKTLDTLRTKKGAYLRLNNFMTGSN